MRSFQVGGGLCDRGARVEDGIGDVLGPGRTNLPGVFVAGSAAGAKDIPDSILHAGAAVAQAAAHLERAHVNEEAKVTS